MLPMEAEQGVANSTCEEHRLEVQEDQSIQGQGKQHLKQHIQNMGGGFFAEPCTEKQLQRDAASGGEKAAVSASIGFSWAQGRAGCSLKQSMGSARLRRGLLAARLRTTIPQELDIGSGVVANGLRTILDVPHYVS